MTGYGAHAAEANGLRVEVELHSVNHRGLHVQVTGPREWGNLEKTVTDRLRESASRGKFFLQLNVSRVGGEGEPSADWEEVDRRVRLLRETIARHAEAVERDGASVGRGADTEPLPVEVLYRILCDSQREGAAPAWDEAGRIATDALDGAIEALLAMREEEGRRLAGDMERRISKLRACLAEIEDLDEGRVHDLRETLLSRLRELDLELDPTDDRVAKEVALLADRSDISEETARISSHLAATAECLEEEGPVGRKLEFLLQELQREFNTAGSKSPTPLLSTQIIEAKQEIEKLREQSANIE